MKGKSAIHIARVYSGKRQNFTGPQFWARAILLATTVDAFGEADVVRVPALTGELRRILKHEDRPF